MNKKLEYPKYIYYQEEWNESREEENRKGEVLNGRTSPVSQKKDDTEDSRGR